MASTKKEGDVLCFKKGQSKGRRKRRKRKNGAQLGEREEQVKKLLVCIIR
jgi:hypothetical protein